MSEMTWERQQQQQRHEAEMEKLRNEKGEQCIVVFAIAAVAVVLLLIVGLIVYQHIGYQQRYNDLVRDCVNSGAEWKQNLTGNWECVRR